MVVEVCRRGGNSSFLREFEEKCQLVLEDVGKGVGMQAVIDVLELKWWGKVMEWFRWRKKREKTEKRRKISVFVDANQVSLSPPYVG